MAKKNKSNRRPIHTRYDQFGGYSNISQTQQNRPSHYKSILSLNIAKEKEDEPINRAVLDEIEKLLYEPGVKEYWHKQTEICIRAKAEYEAKRTKGQKVNAEDNPLPGADLLNPEKHLPAFYTILAIFQLRHRRGFNRLITKETLTIYPDIKDMFLFDARLRRDCLYYVKADLKKESLLGSKPEEERTNQSILSPCHKLALDSFCHSLCQNENLIKNTLKSAYRWLAEPENHQNDKNPYKGCEIPGEGTWLNYLRRACKFHNMTTTQVKEEAERHWAFAKSQNINILYEKDLSDAIVKSK